MANRSGFLAVTGAQGVGKSRFCNTILAALQRIEPEGVQLMNGLGDALKAYGVPLGSASNADTIAAVFAAHLEREQSAAKELVILDRCVVDALAYALCLGVSTPAQIKLYEAIAVQRAREIDLVVHLIVSDTFATTTATHEAPELRAAVARSIPEIIERLQINCVTVDAAAPDALQLVLDALQQAR